MRFQPKSETDIAAANLLAGGEYIFEVAEAEEQTSKSGNDMVKLKLNVFDDDERRYVIFDYLVSTDGAAYKLRHFAESVGLLPEYEAGDISAAQMVGCTGKCQVGIQKDKAGQYPDKNVIRDYCKVATAAHIPAGAMNGSHNERNPPPVDDEVLY